MDSDGWVILMGVDQTSNTSIHLAEQLALRKQFVRWALTPQEIVECPRIPGCSNGFNALSPRLEGKIRSVNLGTAKTQAMRVAELVRTAQDWIATDPEALLCDDPGCVSCTTIRRSVV
jgi:aminoglycoside 3-N-acetyltransferase